MFIFTTRVSRRARRNALLCLCIFAILTGAVVLFGRSEPAEPTPCLEAADNEARLSYLSSFGWQVSPEPLLTEVFPLPHESDAAEYYALARSQGFDLTPYAGLPVTRYSYELLNYPTGERGLIANLLLCGTTVVAGDVCSPALNGFLHGLSMPGT